MKNALFYILAGCLLLQGCRRAPELPVLFTVPAATLIDERGETLPLDALRGEVAIYNFVFTRCAGSCPLMTKKMQWLTQQFDDESLMRFVSVSVDPENDTPAVLAEHAGRVRNDERWIFLTGTREQVIDLSVGGFKLAAGDAGSEAEPVVHSNKFILVDQKGQIRGYYESQTAESLESLVRDAKSLLENG